MAKTMQAIEMDFQNAKRQAEELEQTAHNLSMLVDNHFQQCIAATAANWKGDNAAAFCKKGYLVGNHIKDSADSLRNIAAVMRQIAENTYQAEKNNYEIAKSRNF